MRVRNQQLSVLIPATFMRSLMFLHQTVIILMTDSLLKHQHLLKELNSAFLTGMVYYCSGLIIRDIEWDGTYNGKIVSPGIYFYQCEVYENRASGVEQFHLSGFVHVITVRDAELKQVETK